MSEPKRVSLTSIGTNRKEKRAKEILKTIRFTLSLSESNEEACPEFNYRGLLKSAEKNHKKEVDGQSNGIDPLDDEDDAKLKQLARHYEEKYGGSTKQKHGRFEDYADLGAGYDETDPFIDNTDAYDEIVPEEMTTEHGGFYINCGALEFKEVSDVSETDEIKVIKSRKRFKRIAHVDNQSDNSNGEKLCPEKKPKIRHEKNVLVNKRKLGPHERDILKKRKKRAIGDLTKRKAVTVKELLREKREALELEPPAPEPSSGEVHTAPGPDLQENAEAKKDLVNTLPKVPNSIQDVIESVVSAAHDADSSKDSSSSASKSREESVACLEWDASQGEDQVMDKKSEAKSNEEMGDLNDLKVNSVDVQKDKNNLFICKGKDENSDLYKFKEDKLDFECLNVLNKKVDYVKISEHLPDNLPQDVRNLISILQEAAKSPADGRNKFFSSGINQNLLSLEIKCQALSNYQRQQVYGALSLVLPCTKDTLIKKVKKLRLQAEEDKLKEPLRKLKEAIDTVMPSVLELFTKECQKAAEEQGIEDSNTLRLSEPNSSILQNESKIPKRRFPWTTDLRILLCQLVRIKLQCLDLQKPRKETADDIIRKFLDVKVKPLWPPGWMEVPLLLQECKDVYPGPLVKLKKLPAIYNKKYQGATSTSGQSVQSTVTNGMTSVKNATPQKQDIYTRVKSVNEITPTKSVSPITTTNSAGNSKLSCSVSPSSPSSAVHSPIKSVPVVDVHTKVPAAGKSSPNFQTDAQHSLTISTIHSSRGKASTLEKSGDKGLDLTVGNLVFNSENSKKMKNSEISIIPVSGLSNSKTSPLAALSIPDCISVTPSMPSPSQTTVNTSPKSIMSRKQRILCNTSKEQNSGSSTLKVANSNTVETGDNVDIISVGISDTRSISNQKVINTKEDFPGISKMPVKRKRKVNKDTEKSVDSNLAKEERVPKLVVPVISEKEAEQLNEETAAATDLLSQINESLTGYQSPSKEDSYQIDKKCQNIELSNPSVIQKTGSVPTLSHTRHLKSISADKSVSENELTIQKCVSEDKSSVPASADAEESVQLEVNRVMKELMVLQGHMTSEKCSDNLDKKHTNRLVPGIAETKQSHTYESSNSVSVLPRRDTGKSSHGFQDEFHKHLFQDGGGFSAKSPNFSKSGITISPVNHIQNPKFVCEDSAEGSGMVSSSLIRNLNSNPAIQLSKISSGVSEGTTSGFSGFHKPPSSVPNLQEIKPSSLHSPTGFHHSLAYLPSIEEHLALMKPYAHSSKGSNQHSSQY